MACVQFNVQCKHNLNYENVKMYLNPKFQTIFLHVQVEWNENRLFSSNQRKRDRVGKKNRENTLKKKERKITLEH